MIKNEITETKTEYSGLVDLNYILQILIIIVSLFIWIAYITNGINKYIDNYSVILAYVLAAELLVFLVIEKKNRDPFIILLCFQNLIFFLFRIGTLLIYPISLTFFRMDIKSSDINETILFIIASNLALFAGFNFSKIDNSNKVIFHDVTTLTKKSFFSLYIICLIMNFIISPLAIVNSNKILSFIGIFNSVFLDTILFTSFLFIYSNYFVEERGISIKLFSYLLIIFYLILTMVVGSRSSFLTILVCYIISQLSQYSFLRIRRSQLLIAILFMFFSLPLYSALTEMRNALGDKKRQQLSSENVSEIFKYKFLENDVTNYEYLLGPVFARMGFLDFATEVIAGEEKYSEILNMKYYAKSIIDNVLTPGFDIWDTPKAANAARFVYENQSGFSKSFVAQNYQSDSFTLYGEFYVAFGKWFSLVPIFLLSFWLKRIYVSLQDNNHFFLLCKQIIILYVFYGLIQSFGIDWIIASVVGYCGTFILSKRWQKLSY